MVAPISALSFSLLNLTCMSHRSIMGSTQLAWKKCY